MLGLLRRILRRLDSGLPAESVVSLHELRDYHHPLGVHHQNGAAPGRTVRLAAGRFQVEHGSCAAHLLTGWNHILVSKSLAGVLRRCCGNCIEVVPCRVEDALTRRKLGRYVELRPRDELTVESLMRADASGAHVWHWEGSCLLVTKQVMLAIQKAGIRGLIFVPHTLSGSGARVDGN